MSTWWYYDHRVHDNVSGPSGKIIIFATTMLQLHARLKPSVSWMAMSRRPARISLLGYGGRSSRLKHVCATWRKRRRRKGERGEAERDRKKQEEEEGEEKKEEEKEGNRHTDRQGKGNLSVNEQRDTTTVKLNHPFASDLSVHVLLTVSSFSSLFFFLFFPIAFFLICGQANR